MEFNFFSRFDIANHAAENEDLTPFDFAANHTQGTNSYAGVGCDWPIYLRIDVHILMCEYLPIDLQRFQYRVQCYDE